MALGHIARASVGFLLLVATGVAGQARAQNWDGQGQLRFGAFLQGSFTDFDALQTPQPPSTLPPFRQSVSPDALGAGASFGYDMRFGKVVLGVETDASFDGTRAKVARSTPDEYSSGYLATIRGRFGYLVHPNVLAYGTVGLAALGAQYKFNGQAPGVIVSAQGVFDKKDATMTGLSVGGGLEYDAGWGIVFGEYLHNDYGSWTFGSFNGNRMAIDASGSVVRGGLKFKIGHDFEWDDSSRYAPLK
jgi:opacity protein-like surface antigen